MEAIGDFIPQQATEPGTGILRGVPRLASVPPGEKDVDRALDAALALLRSSNATVVPDAALFGVAEASDFAGRVEELSRIVDYWQLVAAGGGRPDPKRGSGWSEDRRREVWFQRACRLVDWLECGGECAEEHSAGPHLERTGRR